MFKKQPKPSINVVNAFLTAYQEDPSGKLAEELSSRLYADGVSALKLAAAQGEANRIFQKYEGSPKVS